MTEGTEAQVDFTLEADWRMSLPPVFRPIAERYGQRKFNIAYSIGSVQEAVTRIMPKVEHHTEFKQCMMFIVQGMNCLASEALANAKMDSLNLAEIKLDIERAAQLEQASRVNGGKLILPS